MKLHTTVIRVHDLERSHDWYVNKLGMREIYRDLRYRLRSYALGEQGQLTLWELPPGSEHVPMTQFNGYVVLISEAIEDERTALEQRGVAVDPIIKEDGLRVFWITDPDGNKLAVLQFELD